MTEFIDIIKAQLGNQLIGGGLVLMVTGALMALARQVPANVWSFIKRRCTVEVEIYNSDPCFDFITQWLDKQPYSKRSRRLTATTDSKSLDGDTPQVVTSGETTTKKKPRILLTPAPGTHVFWHKGSIIWLTRSRETAPGASGVSSKVVKKSETYHFTTIARSQNRIRELLDEIIEVGAPIDDSIKLWYSSFGYWESNGPIKPRKLDTVILPEDTTTFVKSDIEKFLSSQDWYRDLGIPWHRGYLLFGKPGTGKTSLVTALAGDLKMSMYLLNLGTNMDDEKLANLLSSVQSNSIVLVEDIDCVAPKRDPDSNRKEVTLSGLLNCLDGVQSKDGCLIFMTTNDRSVLDEALLRPGRVDVEIEFKEATSEQIIRLKNRISPALSNKEALKRCQGMTMAQTQKELLK